MAYSDLWRLAGETGDYTLTPVRNIHKTILYHIGCYEQQHERPPITALVVQKETGKPGQGYAKLLRGFGIEVPEDEATRDEAWSGERDRVLRFWSTISAETIPLLDAIDAAERRTRVQLNKLAEQTSVQR